MEYQGNTIINQHDMKYFSFEELTKSSTAERLGIDNTPPAEIIDNLHYLVEELLDPVRELWGAPLFVTSGYRCEMLNTAVGGSAASAHRRGMAADIVTGKGRQANNELFELIRISGIAYDQIINELGGRWLHLGAARVPRHQALTYDGKIYRLLA